MSVKAIINESVNKNPIGLKEALETELRARVAEALEAKLAEAKGEDDDTDEDEDEDEEDEHDEDEEEEAIDEALSPSQRAAREANRTGGRLAKGDNRNALHSELRGKKGSARTAMGVDPIKGSAMSDYGKSKMSKIGKHGSAYDNSDNTSTAKDNRLSSLHKSRNANSKVKGKLPEEFDGGIDEGIVSYFKDIYKKVKDETEMNDVINKQAGRALRNIENKSGAKVHYDAIRAAREGKKK